jgi:type IV secretion system protein VirB3
MAERTPGFEAPIHRSLTEPISIAGLPRRFAILLWTPSLVIVLGLYQLWFLPIALAVHALFAALTRREPHFIEVFPRALRAQRTLEP